jgi:hypothetical protein
VTPLFRRLVPLLALGAAAAFAGSASAAAPANVTLPKTSGSLVAGKTLSTTNGTWSGSVTSYTYQWRDCDFRGDNCVAISGATAASFVLTTNDVGHTLDVVVTAHDASGDTAATSLPTPGIVGWSALGTPHFVIHYSSDATSAAAITQTQAGDIAALAERAYAAETAAGYPAPRTDEIDDQDPRVDIYVDDISSTGALGLAAAVQGAAPSYGYIFLNGAAAADAFTQKVIAHELFHLVQYQTYVTLQKQDKWLVEGTAEWMGNRVTDFTDPLAVGGWDMSLDCRDPNGTYQCSLTSDYENGGYSRWPFFEFLAERWGGDFNQSVLAQAQTWDNALTGLSKAIEAKGSSLTDVFNDWAVANMTGGYSVAALQKLAPATYASISAGTLASLNAGTAKGAAPVTSGPIPVTTVAVNHLATRYVAVKHGAAAADGPCYKATLALNVALPSGVAAKPYFWWSQLNPDGSKQAAQAFTVNGSNASLTLPWDTCDWGASKGYISLPNPSTTVDAADFKITGTLAIDRTQEATATPPPDPVKIPGQAIDAGSGEAPRIQVFGPQLIHIGAGSRQLRVIVQSSDTGALQAALGSVALGSARLRAGSNDVRFSLPDRAVRALRTTSTASNALTLTPVSSGGAAGKAVLRKVVIERAAAPRKLAKPAAKKTKVKKPR